MDETKILLEQQIDAEIEKLSTMEDGSEEKEKTIDGLSKLYRLKIEESKNDLEAKSRDKELKDQKWNNWIGHGITVLGTGATLVFNWIWLKKTLKFEETGALVSNGFKFLQNGVKHLKK